MMILRVRLATIALLLAATACMSDQPTAPMASAKNVNPPATPLPLTDSIRVSPLTVPAGAPATGIITLKTPAPAGGLVIQLFSSIQLTATLPATVTAPAGAKIVTFPIQTFIGFPNSTTTPRIDALVNGILIGTGVNVVTGAPTSPPPLAIASVVLSPSTVVGGNPVQGTINLNAAAPAGGAFVSLQSTNTAFATTPTGVTIAAGAKSASFSIATVPVTTTGITNIAGGFAGGFLATSLNVTPPVTGPIAVPTLASPAADSRVAPGTNITFDWNDVAGAVSYDIQISDNSNFSSTIVSQTVAASQFATSTLPTKTMWWRVRATSSSGTTTAFSAPRRFEVKQ
jgi:hypothetical protein